MRLIRIDPMKFNWIYGFSVLFVLVVEQYSKIPFFSIFFLWIEIRIGTTENVFVSARLIVIPKISSNQLNFHLKQKINIRVYKITSDGGC